jgi:hypothetical protein
LGKLCRYACQHKHDCNRSQGRQPALSRWSWGQSGDRSPIGVRGLVSMMSLNRQSRFSLFI